MGRPKVSPGKMKLTSQHLVRAWVRRHEASMSDYVVEHQLARGQLIIKKLEAIVEIFGSQGVPSPVYDMAVTLLHDPDAIDETTPDEYSRGAAND